MSRALLLLAALACGGLAACSGSDEDRAHLVGRWNAVERPPDYIEFREDGVFEYVNGTGIKTVLQIFWKIGSGQSVVLSMADGVNPRRCYYKLEGDHLTFDNGSGASCIPAEPDDMSMPLTYQRAGK